MDGHVAALLELLAEGAQARKVLATRMGLSDRKTRGVVEEARRRGELVIWLDGLYRLASSASEFEEWARREQRSRLGTLHAQLSAMTRSAQRLWPAEQIRLAI